MRTIIEKYQRIMQIREQYCSEIESLATKQIGIMQRVYKELGVENHYDHRDIMRYDSIRIDESGNADLYEYDRCDRRDSFQTTVYIDPLVVSGNFEGYEQKLRASLKVKAEEAAKAKEKEKADRRARLEKDLVRISAELAKEVS